MLNYTVILANYLKKKTFDPPPNYQKISQLIEEKESCEGKDLRIRMFKRVLYYLSVHIFN